MVPVIMTKGSISCYTDHLNRGCFYRQWLMESNKKATVIFLVFNKCCSLLKVAAKVGKLSKHLAAKSIIYCTKLMRCVPRICLVAWARNLNLLISRNSLNTIAKTFKDV